MGTRAQFFVGDPRDIASREYLGTIAYDGYVDSDIGNAFKKVKTEKGFRDAIKKIAKSRDDFADPKTHSFPFPWKDDLFLTDYTYAFFNDTIMVTHFHRGFRPIADFYKEIKDYEKYPVYKDDAKEELSRKVPAPVDDEKPKGADSIMILVVK